jgi:hypothetical protein
LHHLFIFSQQLSVRSPYVGTPQPRCRAHTALKG